MSGLLLIVASLLPMPASAQEDAAAVVARGRALYDEADFEAAALAFGEALEGDGLEPALELEAHRYLAVLRALQGEPELGRVHAEAAVRIDRDVQPPPGASRDAIALFDEARARREPAPEPVEEPAEDLPAPYHMRVEAPVSEPQPVDAQAGAPRLVAGGTLLAAGGLFTALLVYSVVRINHLNDDARWLAYRQLVPAGDNACFDARNGFDFDYPGLRERALEVCDSFRRLERSEWVFTGLAIASLATGSVLLIRHFRLARAERVSLLPRLGPRQAGLGVSVTY